MALTPDGYKKRLIDDILDERLKLFGAVSLEGPKWCGKTWTSLNHANSKIMLDDDTNNYSAREQAKLNPSLVLDGDYPRLIDEWGAVPTLWDAVRHRCDKDKNKGKYILTESTTLRKKEDDDKILHSGAGRIDRLRMHSMSLFETGDSLGEASLSDMFSGSQQDLTSKQLEYRDIANLIIRGGWPENVDIDEKHIHILPQSYINAVLVHDISGDGINRDVNKMRMLMRALARNESSLATNSTLISDIEEYVDEKSYQLSRNSVSDYLDILEKLHLTEDQPPYAVNLRSHDVVGKSAKHHFADPSLACAILGLTTDRLMSDPNTMGLFFEALAEHDLRVYIEHLGGKLYHYRNNATGFEIDAVVELPSGEIGVIEIKLGADGIESAKQNLIAFDNEVKVAPQFKCVICGLWGSVVRDPETGIYIAPLTALGA